jgi:hypothetical protein
MRTDSRRDSKAPLYAVLILMALPACGGSSNPVTSSSPSPTPPPVTRSAVIDDDAFAVPSKFAVPDVWTTTSTGTVEVTVDWTFATNDVDIFVARGSEPCTLQTLNNRTCGFVATEESTTMKPEKLSMPNLAAGTYTLYVVNFGSTDESVACHIVLTTTSAASVRTVTTGGAARKGSVNGIRQRQ